MAYQFIEYEKKGHIAYVTINRPKVMNSLHPPANRELSDIFDDFNDDDNCWIAIVTGAGEKAFSAGNDLKYTAEHGMEPLGNGGFGGITYRFDSWKPLIAAVNGYALGGGFEIALACDIIIASENALFGLPEPTVGLMAGAGGVHRLPRQIPLKIAMGMMLTGKPISAKRAHEVGIANEVVPLADLITTAEKWAADIMLCAPMSVRASKQSSTVGLEIGQEDALMRKYPIEDEMKYTEDYVEGPKAFAEKRTPTWKGK